MGSNFRTIFPDIERENIVKIAKKTLWSKDGEDAMSYLAQERLISKETIDLFNVGFCPKWANHELRGRIITPIYDPYGGLSFLSTRIPRTKDKNTFFHEAIANKGMCLYGIHMAKNAMIKRNKAIIVEGEMDTLFLQSQGFDTTVGILGCAFSIFHLSILSRYTNTIYYVVDGDRAGQKSIEKSINLCRRICAQTVVNFIPVYIPNGLDPDDYIKKYGKKYFAYLLKQSEKNKI